MGRTFTRFAMKSTILKFLTSLFIFITLSDVGAERIKLLPDSLLARGEKFVIGGQEVGHGEFPFQVSLQIIGDRVFHNGHRCGGTILNEYTVLTAAHCFDERPSNGHFEVVAGSNILKGPHQDKQRRWIDRIFIHPQYSQHDIALALINDIAVIRVRVPFIFNHFVNAARLPQADVYPQGDAQVCGWGSTDSRKEDQNPSETLQVVDLPLLPQVECEACVLEGQRWKSGVWVKTLICTKPLSGNLTPYKGDSGGPLVQDDVVVGIVSTGETELSSTLAIYTRVSAFRQWIDSKMSLRTISNSEVHNEL